MSFEAIAACSGQGTSLPDLIARARGVPVKSARARAAPAKTAPANPAPATSRPPTEDHHLDEEVRAAEDPFHDNNAVDIDENDPSLRTSRFLHFFIQHGIDSYNSPSNQVSLGTYPKEGYGREQGQAYH
ncbi:hypothetical protein CLAFUW4_06543 [Fulvia fulva]|uniref:uncharacterized protein n=1 Tax=Passalora fulva TaxID=5499 RepID=UPI002852C346|nr:uncharacterized protein CLAFUR5_20219 [Fulvia fulva]KAK4621846.1 hypothetical protein CLAFUR4_06551 [Fulvia fulva]KAK4623334.1 hypothetical protein CLAFUR0_06547 [Fulvia fulva]WMI38916.1 hypothetical protein CLAFUR5_20219 [Fulvia fulva]WPV16260.1 hypothetical protein CLAFUW4_06543 [Fulvia fulva]WPV31268.1 hypothetical protein CLAFUW7_06542 [Fulvia fulva]